MTKVGIVGNTGRMGQLIQKQLAQIPFITLGLGYSTQSFYSLEDVVKNNDMIIDFSSSLCSEKLIDTLLNFPKPLILGTTLPQNNTQIEKQLFLLSKKVPVVVCPNTSLGAYLQKQLSAYLARVLDDAFDIRVSETHHRRKKDKVSGTAQDIITSLCQAKKQAWDMEYGVNKSSSQNIELHVSRLGNIFGEHEVTFVSDEEMISIRHEVFSRDVFVKGTIRILRWLIETSPSPGYYGPEVGLKVNM